MPVLGVRPFRQLFELQTVPFCFSFLGSVSIGFLLDGFWMSQRIKTSMDKIFLLTKKSFFFKSVEEH